MPSFGRFGYPTSQMRVIHPLGLVASVACCLTSSGGGSRPAMLGSEAPGVEADHSKRGLDCSCKLRPSSWGR